MSDEEFDSHVPDSKLHQLEYSITNLWEMWGTTDNVAVGLVANTLLVVVGLVVFMKMSGIVSFLGAIWAAINAFGIIKWVISL